MSEPSRLVRKVKITAVGEIWGAVLASLVFAY
jgi:hypothetical protein